MALAKLENFANSEVTCACVCEIMPIDFSKPFRSKDLFLFLIEAIFVFIQGRNIFVHLFFEK